MVGSGGGSIVGTTLVYTSNQLLRDGYGGFLSFASKGKYCFCFFVVLFERSQRLFFKLHLVSLPGVSDIECFLLQPFVTLLLIPTFNISP